MPLRLRILLDTNVLIPLEDSMVALAPNLANFARLCNEHGHQLLYHPASLADINRDPNAARRKLTLSRLKQYAELDEGPPCPWNNVATSVNDACDNEILYALERDAAHALVTEDRAIHRKAKDRGLGDRVYFIQSAEDWLHRLHGPGKVQLPYIVDVELHTLTDQLPTAFFDSIRSGYKGFNKWFREKAKEGRRAWIYRDKPGDPVSAICIYAIQTSETINEQGERLRGDALKLCTFKVGETVRGRKIGELFLRAAFLFATRKKCANIFLHANPKLHTFLTDMIEDYGFEARGTYGKDAVYVKRHPVKPPALICPPFDYVKRFYPHYLSGNDVRKFLVPIWPEYHEILFPDFLDPTHKLPANHPRRHVGNAIKLAYLCHAPSNEARPGDIVLFYRTRDAKAVTTLGVVESYKTSSLAEEIAQMVSRRTVYSSSEIAQMAERPTRVMLFRVVHHFAKPVSFSELKAERVVRGPIQSITHIPDESFSRILRAAGR